MIGSATVSNAAFADFWTRLANEYKDNDRVIFGLMNEPNTMPTEQWREAANAAIAAIRNTGQRPTSSSCPETLGPGPIAGRRTGTARRTRASCSASSIRATTLRSTCINTSTVIRPARRANRFSPTIGQERLVEFTNWLHANNRRGFLGEFAVANSPIGTGFTQIGDEAINNMLSYIEANEEVWLGWTWWAGGPWWGEYKLRWNPRTSASQVRPTAPRWRCSRRIW